MYILSAYFGLFLVIVASQSYSRGKQFQFSCTSCQTNDVPLWPCEISTYRIIHKWQTSSNIRYNFFSPRFKNNPFFLKKKKKKHTFKLNIEMFFPVIKLCKSKYISYCTWNLSDKISRFCCHSKPVNVWNDQIFFFLVWLTRDRGFIYFAGYPKIGEESFVWCWM